MVSVGKSRESRGVSLQTICWADSRAVAGSVNISRSRVTVAETVRTKAGRRRAVLTSEPACCASAPLQALQAAPEGPVDKRGVPALAAPSSIGDCW